MCVAGMTVLPALSTKLVYALVNGRAKEYDFREHLNQLKSERQWNQLRSYSV
jgi:hypothetical protein